MKKTPSILLYVCLSLALTVAAFADDFTNVNVSGKLKVGSPSYTTPPFSTKGEVWFEGPSSTNALRFFPATTDGYHLIDSNYGSGGSLLPIMITAGSLTAPNLFLQTNGTVGIGIASTPADYLEIRVPSSQNGKGLTLSGAQTPGLKFIASATHSGDRNWGVYTNYTAHGDLVLLHTTSNSGDPYGGVVGMSIQSNGNAYFAGDIEAGGQIKAKFQDIAEWVPATEPMAAGMVVIVADGNRVGPSTDAYDTAVAGVVSPQPGIALGEAGASKVLVATTGRVKVRVDATNAPIHAGDILVSSPIKGTAMKSEPLVLNGRKFHQPGTVIGKALESIEQGTGEILVLLSMQ